MIIKFLGTAVVSCDIIIGVVRYHNGKRGEERGGGKLKSAKFVWRHSSEKIEGGIAPQQDCGADQ